MSEALFQFHAGWRYVVLVAGVVALLLPLFAIRSPTVGSGALRAVRIFTIALDVQLLAGVVLVFLRPFFPALMGHILMMVAAVAVAHLLSVTLRRRPPERRTPAFIATGVGICLLSIIAGILSIGRPIV